MYHFDVVEGDRVFITESRLFADLDAVRTHAMQLALRAAEAAFLPNEDGGAVVVDAYTAEDGAVMTVRLAIGVEMRRNRQ